MDFAHVPILLLVGGVVLLGSIGARVFQWLRIPQVVGYIAIGVLVGRTGLHLIDEPVIRDLMPFNFFALGIIGFMIGGELHRHVFQKHGHQLVRLLVAESLGAFIFVSATVTVLV
ncbi:MAG: cation:proton antiporter, partial [Verrucomicrobia bacterium]|nr:cation:proton antiporter [Verrucomicrobiota bacterium]